MIAKLGGTRIVDQSINAPPSLVRCCAQAATIFIIRDVGFDDLGMEAIYEFEVEDMPVTVAVDSKGESVHNTGPKEWFARINATEV